MDGTLTFTKKSLIIGSILLLAVGWIGGMAVGLHDAVSISDNANRQIKNQLTDREKELLAANEKIGKANTLITSESDVKKKLQADNEKLFADAEAERKNYNLLYQKYQKLQAYVEVNGTGSRNPVGPTLIGECGECSGRLKFGQYADVGWDNYKNGQAKIGLHLGVLFESVTLRQKPKDGILETQLGKIYIVSPDGQRLGEATIDPRSSVSYLNPSTEQIRDLRSQLFLIGTANRDHYGLNLFYSPKGKIYAYGFGVDRPYAGGALQPNISIGLRIK